MVGCEVAVGETANAAFLVLGNKNQLERYLYYVCIYDIMRHIHVTLEDKEALSLEKIKGERSWKDLLMSVSLPEVAHFLDGYHWFWEGEHGGPFETFDEAMNDFIDGHEVE